MELKASVYIETTILSYLVARPSRDLIVTAHQQLTREWWEKHRSKFHCFVSQVVVDEIRRGDAGEVQKRIQAADALEFLKTPEEAVELAEDLLRQQILPPKAFQDAFHIAIASASGMDFLLTWNCTHLANAQIERRVAALCRDRELQSPVICTPEELMVG